jgi:hypothetical protein
MENFVKTSINFLENSLIFGYVIKLSMELVNDSYESCDYVYFIE